MKNINNYLFLLIIALAAHLVAIFLLLIYPINKVEYKPITIDMGLTNEEKLLSCIINAESAPNDTIDAYLVGSTVLNRIEHNRFPDCVHDVVFQRGQYDGINGRFMRTEFSDSIAVRLFDNIGRDCDVLFFYNFKTATDRTFISRLKRNTKLIHTTDNHKFFGYETTL
jgi:hypothetical protein